MNNETEQIYLISSSENQPPAARHKVAEAPLANLENVEEFSNVCRTCAAVTEFVMPIFAGEGLENNLADKIHKHLPIQVSEQDVLPRVVCYQCASTLLAWHELVQCCVQADTALRTRLSVITDARTQQEQKTNNEEEVNTEKENATKWKPCRRSAACTRPSRLQPDNRQSDDNVTNEHDTTEDEDDRPLSTGASKKSPDLYQNFYHALVNFRNHFVTKHRSRKCNYPDFTDSSDSEHVADDIGEINVDSFDDLTHCNKRRDRMDEETKLELTRVQTRINGKVFYTCIVCGKNLSSSHTYMFHKRIHTGERPCVCHVCGKQFRAPNGLQRHLSETHERTRRHVCALCAKSFANSQNLKQHLRIHTGERPFVCAHCGKRFTQSGSLHVHLKAHSEHFPYQCADCDAKFRLRAGLVRHQLKHTGERPHVCAYCGKGFRQKHELNAHSLSHTDAKPHTCAICGAAFRQRRALRHHCKRVHKSEPVKEAAVPLLYAHLGHY